MRFPAISTSANRLRSHHNYSLRHILASSDSWVTVWCLLPFILPLWHPTFLSVFSKRWGCCNSVFFSCWFSSLNCCSMDWLLQHVRRNKETAQGSSEMGYMKLAELLRGDWFSRHSFLACLRSITHWAGIIWYWILILGKYPVILKAFTVYDKKKEPLSHLTNKISKVCCSYISVLMGFDPVNDILL